MTLHKESRGSPYSSGPDWQLLAEHRITKAEGQLDRHEAEHSHQRLWNRGFALALMSLASAVAHGKADGIADLLIWLARNLKP